MSKGTIENPRYPDVEAATFTVAADGTGDFTTIAAALAALPPAGGKLFLKQGTYSIAATITLPNKPVTIQGAGVENTLIDIGANVIAAFTMGFDQPYDFSDFSIRGASVAGQIGFTHTVAVGVTSKTRVRRVNVGSFAVGQRIEKAFINAHLSHVYEIDQGFAAVPTPGTVNNRFIQGPGNFYLRNWTHIGPGGMSGAGVLYLIDGGTIDTTYGCTLAGITAYNTAFRVGAAGGLTLSSGRFFNCTFSPSGPPFAAQYIDALAVVAFGCDFGAGLANAIRLTGSGSIIHGCKSACRVLEVAPADNNRYIDNEGFDGSTIIGANSVVTNWNIKTVSGGLTLDDTYRTVLADATGGAFTIALPAAATCKHRIYTIKKIDSSTNEVTVDPNGAETLDGLALRLLSQQYESITIQSNGVGWFFLADSSGGSMPTVTREPMGFSIDPETNISFTDLTRTLAITPSPGTTFDVWVQGRKFTKVGAQTIPITDTEGLWFFYYDATGTLIASWNVPWQLALHAPVAYVYWDFTNKTAIIFADERHSIVMDWATHLYAHTTIGTRITVSDFPLTGNIAGDGSVDAHAQVDMNGGQFFDEDLAPIVADLGGGAPWDQLLTPIANIPVYYRSGPNNWRKKTANNFPLLESSPAGGRIQWNNFNLGNWITQSAAANGNFVAVWIAVTNNIYEPVVAILGQREDINLPNAQNNNTFGALALGGLPVQEFKLLYRLIFQTATTYANTPKARLRDILDFRAASSLPTGPTPLVTSHNILANRDVFPAHPANAIQNFIATVAVNTLLDATYNTVLVDTSGGARTITLPAAASCPGRIYRIKKATADVNGVTIDPDAAETIDGAATFTWSEYLRSVTIQSTGTAWVIV